MKPGSILKEIFKARSQPIYAPDMLDKIAEILSDPLQYAAVFEFWKAGAPEEHKKKKHIQRDKEKVIAILEALYNTDTIRARALYGRVLAIPHFIFNLYTLHDDIQKIAERIDTLKPPQQRKIFKAESFASTMVLKGQSNWLLEKLPLLFNISRIQLIMAKLDDPQVKIRLNTHPELLQALTVQACTTHKHEL